MNNDLDPIQYNEEEAVKFIRKYLPIEVKDKIPDDEINYVLDIIYDFYEDKGVMDENVSEDAIVEFDEEEMVEYVYKNIKKDKVTVLSKEEVTFLVQGELAYCESIGMFD